MQHNKIRYHKQKSIQCILSQVQLDFRVIPIVMYHFTANTSQVCVYTDKRRKLIRTEQYATR